MNEQDLANQLKAYQDLKKQDKNIDVAGLALAAMQAHAENTITPKEKRIAYFVALGFPPFGLLYALKFYSSGKDDGKHAAYMCVGLTVAAIVLFFVFTNLLFSGSGLSVDQLQQAPAQYQELLQ